jgi:NDP-sugar pyrophosphorylase family protein
MKAIIIAAGRGKRMQSLTSTAPKPMLLVAGKPLIEHIISSLPDQVDELFSIVGYLGDQIKNFCGDNFYGRSVTYIEQEKPLGTGHALKLCQPYINKEKFFVLNADDLFDKTSLERSLKHKLCLLVKEHENPERFGVVYTNEDGSIEKIIEKPAQPESNLVSTGIWLLDEKIFDTKYEVGAEPNGEYYLPKMITKLAVDYKIFVEQLAFWQPTSSPEDLLKAERALNKRTS